MKTTSQKYDAHKNAMNEGGEGFNPYAEQIVIEAKDKAEARIQSIIENIESIRAAWNAAVAKYSKNGKVDINAIAKIEKEAGVTMNEMKIVKARMA